MLSSKQKIFKKIGKSRSNEKATSNINKEQLKEQIALLSKDDFNFTVGVATEVINVEELRHNNQSLPKSIKKLRVVMDTNEKDTFVELQLPCKMLSYKKINAGYPVCHIPNKCYIKTSIQGKKYNSFINKLKISNADSLMVDVNYLKGELKKPLMDKLSFYQTFVMESYNLSDIYKGKNVSVDDVDDFVVNVKERLLDVVNTIE